MLDISTLGIGSVPKRTALGTSRRELPEHTYFGIGSLLVVEQSSMENRPRGVECTPPYTTPHFYGNPRRRKSLYKGPQISAHHFSPVLTTTLSLNINAVCTFIFSSNVSYISGRVVVPGIRDRYQLWQGTLVCRGPQIPNAPGSLKIGNPTVTYY